MDKQHVADVLSRCPVWMNLDSTSGPDEGIELDDGDDFVNRVMTNKPHQLKDNPVLRDLEKVGNKDSDYRSIIHALRTGLSKKSL